MKAFHPSAGALLLLSLATSGFLFSCQSVNRTVPEGSSAEVFFQRAQAETDLSNYRAAEDIFRQYLAQAPEGEAENILGARFEVAVLRAKQGDLEQAIKDLRLILAEFQDNSRNASPEWVRVLSQKKLAEYEAKRPSAAKE